jgi:alkaline phosphatase D
MAFTRERNELLRFLDDHNIKNIVFLVTDMHFAGNILVDQDFNKDGKNLVFYELINGPLSTEALKPVRLDPTINATYLYKEGTLLNFGYFKVQGQHSDGKVHFIAEVRDVEGRPRPRSHIDLIPQ